MDSLTKVFAYRSKIRSDVRLMRRLEISAPQYSTSEFLIAIQEKLLINTKYDCVIAEGVSGDHIWSN